MTPTHFESVDGTRLAYSQMGAGPPIILSDGIGCDHYAWIYLAPELARNFEVTFWNYRGHGDSDPPADRARIAIEDHAQDLSALMDHLEIDRAIHVGHSMGVQVILEFAGSFAERVRALVPVCGSYRRPLDTFRGDDRFKKDFFPHLFRLMRSGDRRFSQIWKSLFPTRLSYLVACVLEINGQLLSREDFQPYLDHMGRMDLDLFARMLEAASEHTAEAILPDIAVPTLIFAGQRDGFTPAWISAEMQERIPGAELCVVPGGSHTAPLEVPELFSLRIEKFFRDHAL